MNLEDIETADCQIESIEKRENEILFRFSELYSIERKEYITDVTLLIKGWTFFVISLNIMDTPFSKGKQKVLGQTEFELMDEISRKSIEDDMLILEGFSKDSGHWMIYEFTDYKYELTHSKS